MRTNKRSWLLGLILLAIWGAALLEWADVLAAPPQGVLKQATHVSISADWLDPATTPALVISSHIALYLLHDALLKPMPDGTYTPCLAESWTISPDSKVYEFKLRRGVKFHNGDILTAEDVAFSFWRNKASQAGFIHGKTEKVEAVNPTTVRFYFKEPFVDFLEYLIPGGTTMGWVVPKKYVEKVGEAGFKKNPVGAGPYQFVEFVPGVKLVAEAFKGYWRKVPSVKRMEFYVVPDPGTRLVMLRRGEVDVAHLISDVYYEDVKKDPKLRLLHPLSASRGLIYISSQWDPKSPWSDPRVRKAASYAIDRKTLADVYMPGSKPMTSLGLEGDPFAVQFPVDTYDPEQAKKLLAQAGYPKGFHGGKFYPYGGYWGYGEQIATYWKAVGISVDIVLLERPAWLADRASGKMKGGIFVDHPTSPTIGGVLSYLFGSGSYGNYPDIQALWDQYKKEGGWNVRKDLMARIQKLIHERTMWIFVFPFNSPTAYGPKVKGDPHKIQPLIWFTAPFEDIELNE